jgi:hypothetical protein
MGSIIVALPRLGEGDLAVLHADLWTQVVVGHQWVPPHDELQDIHGAVVVGVCVVAPQEVLLHRVTARRAKMLGPPSKVTVLNHEGHSE